MTLLRQIEHRGMERRGADPTLPWGSSYIPTNGQIGFSAAGVPMNDDSALSITTVFTCVSLLADAVATLELNSFQRTSDKSKVPITPTPTLVTDPWPEGILCDWLKQVMVSLTLRGNFYGQIVDRDAKGYATTVMPVHPDRVTPRRNPRTGQREYRIDGRLIATADMLHIPAFLVPGSFIGLNPVEYARQSWALAAAAEKFGGQFFANSAHPSGAIKVPHDLSPEETREMARDWKQGHGGLGNAQYPAILTGGAEWQSISISPDDAQFLQTRDFQRIDIASFFRIPVHMLDLQDRTSSWGTGIEQMEIGFVINTLRGWLTPIEGYLSKLRPPNEVVRFDLKGRLRGDTLQRYQSYQIARNAGLMNADEIRFLEDLPPIPAGKGQDYLQPMNMGILGQPKPPAPPNDSGFDNGGGADQAPSA